jgi:nucleotide-binding universal stress UspA family protein
VVFGAAPARGEQHGLPEEVPRVRGGIVCGVDDSNAARDVVAVASSLARKLARPLLLVHGVRTSVPVSAGPGPFSVYASPVDAEAERRSGERLLERLARDLEVPGSAELRVVFGDAATLLPEIAEQEGAEILMLGTRQHSRVKTVLLGSVSSAAISHAPCPLLVVPPGATLAAGPLVCAADDGPEASKAVAQAAQLARGLNRDLVLLHVIAATPAPAASAVPGGREQLAYTVHARGDELLAELAAQHCFGTATKRRAEFGGETGTIRRVADEEDAALIVVGTRRLGAFRAALAGSVSRELMETSERPVLLVPAS